MMLLSEFVKGTKTAQVHSLTEGGYRIVLIDSSVEATYDAYKMTEDEAEQFAEDWVLI